MHKYLETPLHALFSFVDLLSRRCDIALLCNAANSPFAWLVRLKKTVLIINVDGVERKRAKWNAVGRLWYHLGERCSVLFAKRIVADAQVIADYYKERYYVDSTVIAYGGRAKPRAAGEALKKFGLKAREYLLYVSRLEPENNALGVVEAYRQVAGDMPLVIVGDAPYAKEYIAKVKAAADQRVIFTGYQFGEAYEELQSNCLVYIQATEVGGTHPALLEAMAYGNCIIANRVPEHEEALLDSAIYYARNDFSDLAEQISGLLEKRQMISELGAQAKKRAESEYNWEKITELYEQLFKGFVSKPTS